MGDKAVSERGRPRTATPTALGGRTPDRADGRTGRLSHAVARLAAGAPGRRADRAQCHDAHARPCPSASAAPAHQARPPGPHAKRRAKARFGRGHAPADVLPGSTHNKSTFSVLRSMRCGAAVRPRFEGCDADMLPNERFSALASRHRPGLQSGRASHKAA